MEYKILAVNPGSTSTKFALYEDARQVYCGTIEHSDEALAGFGQVTEQLEMRKGLLLSRLKAEGLSLAGLSAVVGRGGMLPSLHAGGYLVNEAMKRRILGGPIIDHASNLGALIADAIAAPLNIPAYIYDAVSADELYDIARITGFPEVIRQSYAHVLNTKAMGRKAAAACGRRYEDMNFITAHLGGGISICAQEKGRIVDVITDDAGPFAPERGGSIPLTYVIDMCYSGLYDKKTLARKLRGAGGLKAHLGTHDCREVERRIAAGDQKAKAVYEAMAYQVAKGIGELAPTLSGRIDAVILTGGVAYSEMLTGWIRERVEFLAPVMVMPGEDEMEPLALGALRILRGEEPASVYEENVK